MIDDAIHRVLELARWAPSGDNTQPWRFEIAGERQVVVHGHDTREHCVYDLHGRASQLSIGALLESIALAASTEGWACSVSRRTGLPETRPTFDVEFAIDSAIRPDPLATALPRRSVQRRPLSRRPLSIDEKRALEAAAGPGFRLQWLDGPGQRGRAARLMFRSARIRLTTPEAFAVHHAIIEWDARNSIDRVPDQALGADALSLKLMRFAMASWQRVHFFNRFLAGTWLPRLQLDLMPALACGAHFVIHAAAPAVSIDEHVAAGRAVQRVWLTATTLGLWQQPEMTPLIFSEYARLGTPFSTRAGALAEAAQVRERLARLFGTDPRSAVWMGRLGAGAGPTARSLRRPLEELLLPASPTG